MSPSPDCAIRAGAARVTGDAMPEMFTCHGCGNEMTGNDFETFDLCRSCDREREAESAADQREDR